MLVFWKMAWRNLFRNKRRTLIAGTAIGIGLASLIFVDALILGMEANMVSSATGTFLGEGQIHRKGYRETQEVELTINQYETVVQSLKQERIVRHFTSRVYSFAMISSPANLTAITLVGVQPRREKYLSEVDESLRKGRYLSPDGDREILIGSKLADILEVGLGDRVVVTVAQAQSGNLQQEMFRVSGIFQMNIPEMDRGLAFVEIRKAQKMFGLDSTAVHEIALKFIEPSLGRDKNLPFWQKYSQYGNEAIGWPKIIPELEAAFNLSDFSIWVTGLILFGVVALGIVNTLFMSLHERMFEFGVLRAIGTRPFQTLILVVFEAVALGIISVVLGNILGFAVTYITSLVGIDYTGIEFAGVTIRKILYPVMQVRQFIYYPFWVFILTSLVGLYPAVYAARMSPVEAMRKSL